MMPGSDVLHTKWQLLKERLALQSQLSMKQDATLEDLKGMTDGIRLVLMQQKSLNTMVMQQVTTSVMKYLHKAVSWLRLDSP